MPIKPFLAFLCLAVAAFQPASAQTWPTRPITMIVPFGAGGSADVVGRLIGQKLSEKLGQTILIENVSGAGGLIGTQRAARAEPDGYTILIGVESTMAIAKLIQPNVVQYDGLNDFQPIALIGTSPIAVLARKDFPASTTDELLKLLRANPSKYSFATSGVGSSLHLAGELISLEGKAPMTHLPYRVGSQVITDLAAGHIDLAVLTLVTALPPLRSGQIKAFGIASKDVSPLAPELKPMADDPDLKKVDVSTWFGLFAPARTDPAIVERLNRETNSLLADPAMRARLADLSVQAVSGDTPAAFKSFLASEIEKYGAIVKAANIKLE
ncbi:MULTISPECIES: tripartite tricarboxylate transporter substrate-binding protein [unclassified Beijerinckia]|uniref:Bug family tripartite tricarboxylate transporter substrate binding protein n=1 Tax=unclassified Beijerinckia TaxID=2638183 RepID=UPI00089584AE|nr:MULTISPECIES: tripartite tricarboxylate transporter substrate-binding protein [unclassified Beijerinckia]MDH7799836.1 tripartite-type tricarboxylate transporter receptor subunit TctC [Beijerinckia sp. GAS462]SED39254.1 Tripartite-type tricarboxylate transporter, receptor component TctC [Beijerinckia sp. 28-YEA-48]